MQHYRRAFRRGPIRVGAVPTNLAGPAVRRIGTDRAAVPWHLPNAPCARAIRTEHGPDPDHPPKLLEQL